MATMTVTEPLYPPDLPEGRRAAAARARLRAGAQAWDGDLRQRRDGLRDDLARSSACTRSCWSGWSVAGAAWVWVLPGRARRPVPADRGSTPSWPRKFPLANGAYQWSRRLVGPRYGWFNGWVALCAYAVANTTIAYLGAPWALTLLGITPTAAGDRDHGRRAGRASARWSTPAASTPSRPRCGSAWRPRRSPRSASVSRCCSSSASRASRVLTDTFGAESLSGGSTFARATGRARRRRLGLHRLRRDGRRRRGDQRLRQARPARGLDRAAERRRAGDPQRLRDHARAPEPRRRRRRQGPRPRLHRGRRLVRRLVEQAVRRRSCCSPSWPAGWPRRAGPRAGSTRWRATACCPARSFLRRVDRRQAPIGGIVADDA